MANADKLKTCKHCGAQIAKSAKVCPNCGGKNKKPIWQRVWFWLLIAVLLIGVIGGGNSSKKESKKVGEVGSEQTAEQTASNRETAPDTSKNEASAPAQESAAESEAAAEEEEQVVELEEEPVQEVFHVGDVLQDGDVRIVYAASGVYEGDEYNQPEDGYQYIFLKLAFENMSEKNDTSISFYSFEAYADGYAADMYYGGDEDLSATLSAGRSTMGYLYFTVPVDAQDIEVEYSSNFWTDEKITFAYDGEADSGYALEKDTSASPDAHAVGETVELSGINITYLACEDYESDNMFVTPADGCHFVKCIFEFENTGKSDAYVSSYEFDAFADGINCNQTFIADDDLSATISSGRKAKGSVVFEIPDDAQTVEVEYLDNVWTSNRVVFTVQ